LAFEVRKVFIKPAIKYIAANKPWTIHNTVFILTLLELFDIIQLLDKQHVLQIYYSQTKKSTIKNMDLLFKQHWSENVV